VAFASLDFEGKKLCQGLESLYLFSMKKSPANFKSRNLLSESGGHKLFSIDGLASPRTFYLSTAITLFFIYYSRLLLLPGSYLLQDPDTFWHIRTGQWILEHAQFPTVDVFSYTAKGNPWIPTEWLSEILFALAFKLGGWRAVVALTSVTAAGLVSVLAFYLLRHVRFSVAIGCTALVALSLSPHFLARPHIFSYVLVSIWLANLLDAYDDNFDLPPLRVLIPLMILWANLHGSFTFGLMLLYVFSAVIFFEKFIHREYTECGRLVLKVFAASASALINPYGISAALMTLELLQLKFTIPRIVELRPPDFQTHKIHLLLFVGLLASIAALGIRLRGARLLSFALIMVIGLSYLRGLIMYFCLAPFILARPTSESAPYMKAQLSSRSGNKKPDSVLKFLRKRFIAVPLLCASVAMLVSASMWWRQDIVPSKNIAPQQAIDFVERSKIGGNVFNDYGFGGFLTFLNIPTFVDGRALPFGDAFLRQYFETVNVVDIERAFATLDNYKVTWIILRPDQSLAKAIAQSASWKKVYSDNNSVVFVRQ
jgi:hypothetical protein